MSGACPLFPSKLRKQTDSFRPILTFLKRASDHRAMPSLKFKAPTVIRYCRRYGIRNDWLATASFAFVAAT
jgi:hypothetical protein